MSKAPLQRLIDLCLARTPAYSQLCELAAAASTSPPALLDELSLHVARAFADGAIPFATADHIMNSVFGAVTEGSYLEVHRHVPDLTYEVYLAFDGAELLQIEPTLGTDAVDTRIRPAICDLLKRLNNPVQLKVASQDAMG